MPVIETIELRKQYGPVVAVDGLTLSVEQGEVFGFLGPNGAGKTTTVKALLGLVHLTSGRASILGRPPGDPAAMARVGFLPEHFHFHPWLKAGDFLDLHARLYRIPAGRRRRRITQLLEQVGLADRAGTRLAEFSKGMSQRIGLAQALLNQPDLVFLDEPTSGLDPLGRRRVRDIIRDLRGQGVTVFLNSHLLSEVELTCDRVAIIQRGRVVRVGSIDALTGSGLEVEIRATGLTPALQAGLAQWGMVAQLEDGRLSVRVADDGVLPAIADWLVAGGARLYALSPRRLSLEELFVRILEAEAGSESPWGEE
jgi:ABC-2 type transport system ATP-binding protein